MGFFTRITAAGYSALEFHVRRYAIAWGVAAIALASIAASAWLLIAPPSSFPGDVIVIVEEGDTAPDIAQKLADAHVVLRPELLRAFWRLSSADAGIPAGPYRFAAPETLPTVARRLVRGDYGIPQVSVTFPEGLTVLDMGRRVSEALPHIPVADFISAGQPYEGYLFPDTYTLDPADTAASIVARARANFDEKIAPLMDGVTASGRSLSAIVIMASIIEREAARHDDRRMVSGILWNRIEREMPLQVDAVFGYIYSRQTYSPSYADLTVDSPYNTYKYKGLPPGPISNPSLDAIEAALNPTETKYLFYLTGRDGNMYYATTYQGHEANLNSYLR